MTTLPDQPITLTANGPPRQLAPPRPAAPLLLRVVWVVVKVLRWVIG